MIGSTAPSSIWGGGSVGCYPFRGPPRTVSLAIYGGPVPVGPIGYGIRDRLLRGVVSRLTKNPNCFLFLCSPLIELHCRLGICCLIQRWFRLILFLIRGRFGRHCRLFFLLRSQIDHLGGWGSWVSSFCDWGEGVDGYVLG